MYIISSYINNIMYFSSSITVFILLKYRYRLGNEYRYWQKKWYWYISNLHESSKKNSINLMFLKVPFR